MEGTWQRGGQTGVSFLFYNLMKDPKGIQLFRDFLKVHHNHPLLSSGDSPLSFILEVQRFKSLFYPSSLSSSSSSTSPPSSAASTFASLASSLSSLSSSITSAISSSPASSLPHPLSPTPTDERWNAANEIYKKYIVTEAVNHVGLQMAHKVAIDSVLASRLSSSSSSSLSSSNPLMESHPLQTSEGGTEVGGQREVPADLFDQAVADVSERLQEDAFKRFIRTPQYEEYQLNKESRNDVGVMLCKLPGEALVHKPTRVVLWNIFIKGFVPCNLYVTNFRLTFGNFTSTKTTDLELLDEICSVPLGSINKLTRSQQRAGQAEMIELHCKDLRKIEFMLDVSSAALSPIATKTLKTTIKSLCFPRTTSDLFAFFFKPTWSERKDWQRYNIYEEFLRQGISFQNWRFTDANHDYSSCSSYPSRFVVPASISDEQLGPVFSYRSRGRIPILCWSHPVTGASISRSSQPNSGVLRTRCYEDEALLKAIAETGGSRTLYLLDARPRANALGNTVKGKGFENVGSYSNCKIEFLGIANIHAMRESLQKIETLSLSGSEDQWHSALDGSKWFDHARDILIGTMRSVELVEQGYPVLLHCSDGWDRTAQLSSLSLLLLDSYYRTIPGFIVLIEKEWLACGHRFMTRIGHGVKNSNDQNRSPVFLQFLDCVYQITLQFGCSFEFNEHFLLTIAHHLYTCQFGTFLFDNDQDRQQHQVTAKTTSLWSYIQAHIQEFENPFYMPDSNVLKIDVHMDKLTYWSSLFLKWVRKSATNIVTKEMRGMMMKTVNEQMAKRIKELEKELAQLSSSSSSSPSSSSSSSLPAPIPSPAPSPSQTRTTGGEPSESPQNPPQTS